MVFLPSVDRERKVMGCHKNQNDVYYQVSFTYKEFAFVFGAYNKHIKRQYKNKSKVLQQSRT